MKCSTDANKREAYGFVVGEALFVIGGYLMGAGDALGHWVPLLGPLLIGCGLFLAVKVFVNVSKNLSRAHSMAEAADIALQNANRDIKEGYDLLEKLSWNIRVLYSEMRKTERHINHIKREIDLKDKNFRVNFEKIFGYSSTFSKHNRINPLEKSLESFEKRLKALEDAVRTGRFGRPAGRWR